MSKAFVKEGEEQEPDATAAESPKPAGPQYITPAGYKKLAAELESLWKVERPRVTREVEAAAALGDRSENAEYIYGKRRLREIDRRLRFLAKRLESVNVVRSVPEQAGRVFFGAHVSLRDEDGKTVTYRLVGSDEIDLEKLWISLSSPMGRALIGKRVGDVVVVQRPKGEAEFEITGVRYDDEGAG